MPEVVQTVEIDVPREYFYEVITDFNTYGNYLPGVTTCQIASHEDSTWEVDYSILVVVRFHYRLRFRGTSPDRLEWELVEGKLMKENRGVWELEAIDGGERTRASYTLDVTPGLFVPKAVTRKLIEVTLPETLHHFKAEAERRHRQPS